MTIHNECPHCGAMIVGLKNNEGEQLLCDAEPIMVIGALGDYRGFKPHTCPPPPERSARRSEAQVGGPVPHEQ